MGNNTDQVIEAKPVVVSRPLFAGRYFIYGGKKYLFTHRHPYKQEYWSDDVPKMVGNHQEYGAWVPTEKLKPCH